MAARSFSFTCAQGTGLEPMVNPSHWEVHRRSDRWFSRMMGTSDDARAYAANTCEYTVKACALRGCVSFACDDSCRRIHFTSVREQTEFCFGFKKLRHADQTIPFGFACEGTWKGCFSRTISRLSSRLSSLVSRSCFLFPAGTLPGSLRLMKPLNKRNRVCCKNHRQVNRGVGFGCGHSSRPVKKSLSLRLIGI